MTRHSLSFIAFLLVVTAPCTSANQLPQVAMVATGGTIAMKVDPIAGGPVPALTGEDLVAAVPELAELVRLKIVNFSNIPSDYMDPERWLALSRTVSGLLEDPQLAGVVITHGTDTLEETAYFLDLTLKSSKPVVCIGAQRNASVKDTDGPRNLINAVRQILSSKSVNTGVTVTMNHHIIAAREARKAHTSNVQTFEPGNYGYLGYVDEGRVVYFGRPLRRQTLTLPTELPRVDLVSMYAGADGRLIRYAVDSGTKGIVVAALGMGNVNQDMYEAIRYALNQGVQVVISTRVYQGRVLPTYSFKGGGATLKTLGAVFADDLTPWKARILLMLTLPLTRDVMELQAYFDR